MDNPLQIGSSSNLVHAYYQLLVLIVALNALKSIIQKNNRQIFYDLKHEN